MVDINWPTGVINVYKTDMTLIQSSPTTIYELDLNDFRLTLKDLEDDIEGMPWLKTHDHNPPVIVGGVELARVVDLLEPYTVTFEDGQYAVNLKGANSNIADRVNVNQVSVRAANSAGLVTSTGIESIEYEQGIWVDATSDHVGTTYPVGTLRRPVNNIPDAVLAAQFRGFHRLYIIGDFTFSTGDDISDLSIYGESAIKSSFTIESGAVTTNAEFFNGSVSGVLDGNAHLECCNIGDIDYVNGCIKNCELTGTITLAGSAPTRIINCHDGLPDGGIPTFDMGGSGQDLVIVKYAGDIKITNLTGTQYVSIDLDSGVIWLDSSVTTGFFYLRGVGGLEDSSTNTVIDDTELINIDVMVDGVWDEPTADHLTAGTTGKMLYDGGTGEAIADAVWDELLSEHVLSGSAGAYLGGLNAAIIADAVWDEVISPDHLTSDTAGEYLYDFHDALASGDIYVSTSTESEIKMVRDRLGDAGTLVAETIVDEMGISTDADTVFTMYQMLYEVNGVWLRSDTQHTGTNYYDGANGSFNQYLGLITLHTSLPADSTEVLISYTYFRGLHDETIDQFLTEAKLYVKKYTRKDYTWSDGLGADPDEETQIALYAAASLAAKRCLESLSAGDILQLGFNFRLGDLEVENMVRGGGFHVQAHIDLLNNDIQQKLAMLGRGMYFVADSSIAWGRDARGYNRRGSGFRRSGVR